LSQHHYENVEDKVEEKLAPTFHEHSGKERRYAKNSETSPYAEEN
jgi:hypothetical protein